MDHAELSSRRVLVADDDRVSRLAMEEMLRACGPLALTFVADGAAAWAQLEGPSPFDLVCLDVRMPAPDGLELVARIRASLALRRLPVMLITGAGDRETQLAATKHELQGFLVKPVGAETAVRVLKVFAHHDATILEAPDKTTARLRIDAERHRRYVAAFMQQVRTLHSVAVELCADGGTAAARTAFEQKADGCRSVALTLGSSRIEQILGDALEAVEARRPGDARAALGLAAHWLERVGATMGAAAAPAPVAGR
jgi:CheY-like chemotaxis protein